MERPRLTSDGKAGLATFFVVLFAAFNTGTNLVYLLASSVAAMLFVSVVACRRGLGDVTVRLESFPELIEGQEGRLALRLRNDGPRPLRFLRVRLGLRNHLDETMTPDDSPFLAELPAGAERRLDMSLRLPSRGSWKVERFELESLYPMGLVRWPRVLPLPTGSILSLPRLLETRFRGVSAHQQETLTEETRAYERGDGADFYGLRRYVRGDPLKFVHWKSTARAGRLMVQEFQKNMTARYYVFLDLSREKLEVTDGEPNLETSIRLAATLCRQLAQENCLSQILIVQEDYTLSPPVFTAADTPLMFRFLATLPYGRDDQLDRVLEGNRPNIIPDSHLIFVLVDLSESTARQILRLARPDQECVAIFNLADESDLDALSATGRLDRLRRAGVRPIVHLRRRSPGMVDLGREADELALEGSPS